MSNDIIKVYHLKAIIGIKWCVIELTSLCHEINEVYTEATICKLTYNIIINDVKTHNKHIELSDSWVLG